MIARYVPKPHIVDASFFDIPLILTESREDFVSFRNQLIREINPRGVLEEIFAAELAAHIWEIFRLQRCKALVVNMAFESALAKLLCRILEPSDKQECDALARSWFSDPEAKCEVQQLLGEIQLDEAAIVAQATRAVLNDLHQLDRMISMQQSLRDKLLRSLVNYRNSFAVQVEGAINRIEERPSLESRPG